MEGHLVGSDEITVLQPVADAAPLHMGRAGQHHAIAVSYGPLDAKFEGRFSEDGQSFAGGWRPNPGADENANVAYDIGGRRLA